MNGMRAESILVVDDEKLIRWTLTETFAAEGYTTFEASSMLEALAKYKAHGADLILLDQRLPDGTGIEVLQRLRELEEDVPVLMLTAVDRVDVAVQAIKLGALDYVTKPVNLEELKVVVARILDTARLKNELKRLREEQIKSSGRCEIVGVSPAMRKVFEFIATVARSNATTVLITGETGTGKELVARAIHMASDRRSRPLMTINCAAVPDALIESELFGHERGAFTDAHKQKKGLFELADGGTVFLDEIGDISPMLQVKLLRVVEHKTFKRVGGTTDISVDVRVIAATNRQLEGQMERGSFRPDLYYRLNIASVRLPPLREREEDVLILAEHFLQQFNGAFQKQFRALAAETREVFVRYGWPGNVRELKNVLERAMLLNDGEYLQPHHVHLDRPRQPVLTPPAEVSLDQLERDAILQTLERTGWNQSRAARLLKVSRDTLRYRMKKFGLMQREGERP